MEIRLLTRGELDQSLDLVWKVFYKYIPEFAKLLGHKKSRKYKMIETNRLKIYAASQEETETFIASQSVDALKEAYSEMLHPKEY